jgi:hypothetical protein
LQRPRIDAQAIERRTMPALPSDLRLSADCEQEIELLGKQLVVVVEVVAEQRKDSMNEPRPAMISARPFEMRSRVANC